MLQNRLTLDLLPGAFAVALLPPDSPVPAWAERAGFLSVTHTPAELSIVCNDSAVPPDVQAQRGLRCLRVLGPLDFSLVGVLASLADPLTQAGISIFALSTYQTDYLFIPGQSINSAIAALSAAGHTVRPIGAA
ncbi:MAG: ACT domain-containing protein [Armatimonadetes bacterium]|nr:ACT domain-containing protein [Armatimonadota bacterium]